MKKFFSFILKSVLIFFAVLLCITALPAFVKPERLGYLFFLEFGLPTVWVINLILFGFVILRKNTRILSLIPLVALVLTYTFFASSIQIFPRTRDKEELKNPFTVMSYNVCKFDYQHQSGLKTTPDQIYNFVVEQSPEIICLQEYNVNVTRINTHPSYVNSKFKNWKNKFVEFYVKSYTTGSGLAIYSKFPIINKKDIRFDKELNFAIYADVKINYDTIRVFNVHLPSMQLGTSDIIDVEMARDINKSKLRKLRSTVRKIYSASKHRADIADELSEIIAQSPYKTVVCGDFNDVPVSYSFNKIKSNLKDSFKESGRGLSQTWSNYGKMAFPIRIDYILHDSSIKSYNYQRFRQKTSDHFPIMVTLEL